MTEKTKKILIIEDEKPVARALNLKLNNNGFNAVMAFDGEEAFELLKKENFDLIICDLVMPRMNGFEVLKNLKKEKNKTPVIILTNLGQEDDEERTKALGAKDFFVKSNTPIEDIVKWIKKFLKN